MTESSPFDYDALLDAVSQTERGRWFLAEFAHRHRAADTEALLGAIHRLEAVVKSLAVPGGGEALAEELHAMVRTVEATEADIRAVRNDMLADHGAVAPGKSAFEDIAGRAHALAADLMATAQSVQEAGGRPSRDSAAAEQAGAPDEDVGRLFELGWTQDVLSQRIMKAMDLIAHLQARIRATLDGEAESADDGATPAEDTPHPAEAGYFDEDSELFGAGAAVPGGQPVDTPGTAEAPKRRVLIVRNPPQEPPPPAAEGTAAPLDTLSPTAEERQRIVVVRRASSADTPIPLEDTPPDGARTGG